MAEVVAWSEVVTQQTVSPRGGVRLLGLLDDCVHTVRFVGNPVRYYAYLVNNRIAICGDPASCPIRAKYHIAPVMRYSANILDRDEADPQQRLKVVDVNPRVLSPVAAWARAHKADPGGTCGCDFSIEAQGSGRHRRYVVTPMQVTPFSDEEEQYIRANLYDLLTLHKPVPAAEIEDRIFHQPGSGKVGTIIGGTSDKGVLRVARRKVTELH